MYHRRPPRFLPIVAIVGIVGLVPACGDSTTQPDPGPSGPTVTTAVNVIDNSFSPTSNAVTTGQTVTWTWNGSNSNSHNVTFDDPSIGNSATKTSGSFARTFDAVGDFTYFCTVHGRAVMSGTVKVATSDASTDSGAGSGYP